MAVKAETKRAQIIEELKKYLSVSELVCAHVLKRDGDKSWRYVSTDALECLLIIRRYILKVPCVINTKNHTQRGYRCNLCELCKDKTMRGQLYATAHQGQAFDILPQGMPAEIARQKIVERADLLPCNIRLEADVSWVHFDTYDDGTATDKVTFFKA